MAVEEGIGKIAVEVVGVPEAVGVFDPAHVRLPSLGHKPSDEVKGHYGDGG